MRERSRKGSLATSESSSDNSETLRPRRFMKYSVEDADDDSSPKEPLTAKDDAATEGEGGGSMLEDAVDADDVILMPFIAGRPPKIEASFSTAGVVAG